MSSLPSLAHNVLSSFWSLFTCLIPLVSLEDEILEALPAQSGFVVLRSITPLYSANEVLSPMLWATLAVRCSL